MNIESNTVRPAATGAIRGRWRERFGDQRVDIKIDPFAFDLDTELRLYLERRWGPQLTDVRRQDLYLSRAGAEALRDALTAALEWEPTRTTEADR